MEGNLKRNVLIKREQKKFIYSAEREKRGIKSNLLLLLLFCAFASFTLAGQSCITEHNKAGIDTVVCSGVTWASRPWEETEFFVTAKEDTSAISCTVSAKDGKAKSINVSLMRNTKICLDTGELELDTSAIGTERLYPHNFYVPTYKGIIHEIDLCLGAASKTYDLRTTSALRCFLSVFGDIAVMTTNQLKSNYAPNSRGVYPFSEITNELAKTPLVNDMNKVLKKYNLIIQSICCENGLIETYPKEVMTSRNISKKLDVPDNVVEAVIIFDITQLQDSLLK